MRCRRNGNGKCSIFIAFGVGLIVSFFCPSGFIIAMLVIALIFLCLMSLRF